MASPADQASLWAFVGGDRGAPALGLLFRTLESHYARAVKLKRYVYEGRVQIHVHVMSDEVFYGWRAPRPARTSRRRRDAAAPPRRRRDAAATP